MSLFLFFLANIFFTQELSVRLLVTLIAADTIVLILKLLGVIR
jgi:hypothetical protein